MGVFYMDTFAWKQQTRFTSKTMMFTIPFALVALATINSAPVVDSAPAPAQDRLLGLIKNVYGMIQLFKGIDSNGDGQISVEEMKEGLLGMLPDSMQNLPAPIMDQLDQHLADFDSNEDGNISIKEVVFQFTNFSEFMNKIIAMLNNGETEERAAVQDRLLGLIKNVYGMIKLFKGIDADGDGQISVDEMKAGLSGMLPDSMQNLPAPIMNQLDQHFEDFDSNGDGFIDIKDVVFQFTNFSEFMNKIIAMINKDQ